MPSPLCRSCACSCDDPLPTGRLDYWIGSGCVTSAVRVCPHFRWWCAPLAPAHPGSVHGCRCCVPCCAAVRLSLQAPQSWSFAAAPCAPCPSPLVPVCPLPRTSLSLGQCTRRALPAEASGRCTGACLSTLRGPPPPPFFCWLASSPFFSCARPVFRRRCRPRLGIMSSMSPSVFHVESGMWGWLEVGGGGGRLFALVCLRTPLRVAIRPPSPSPLFPPPRACRHPDTSRFPSTAAVVRADLVRVVSTLRRLLHRKQHLLQQLQALNAQVADTPEFEVRRVRAFWPVWAAWSDFEHWLWQKVVCGFWVEDVDVVLFCATVDMFCAAVGSACVPAPAPAHSLSPPPPIPSIHGLHVRVCVHPPHPLPHAVAACRYSCTKTATRG